MGATAVTPAVPPRKGPLGGVSARLLRVASDEKLVAAVRQGSQPAFEVIYDRHNRGILSFCRHMLGSREEAEDALQHTYMAAYKALLDSDKDIQLKAWLYTIARNRCLSVLRARREQPSDDIEIASFDGLAAEVQRKVELQDMLRDLAELPEDQRAALVLSEIGDLGHDEIGRVLDVPKDKVKALVFQARSSLQQSRDARETSCQEIREMLATLSGGALRRTTLRRHLKECDGCQAFEADVKRQRRAMAAVLPVVPTLGLKENALAAAFSQTATGGAAVAGGAAAAGAVAGGGSLLGGGASAIVAKVLVATAVAGGGAAGVSAVSDGGPDRPRSAPGVQGTAPAGGAPVTPAATAAAEEEAVEKDDKASEDKPRKNLKARKRGQDDRGKAFAESRGKGNKRGLRGTQPGQEKKERAEKEKAEKRKAREKSAEQKAAGRAKETAKAKRERQRPAQAPPKKPQADQKPQNENSQKPPEEPQPEPEPEPTPSPTVVPNATPEAPGKSRD